MGGVTGTKSELRDVERWFRRRGFTSLLEDTAMQPSPATLARAMAAVFAVILLVVNPLDTGHPWPGAAVGVLALLATWTGLNLLAGRRPFAPPREVTWRERLAFILVPTLAVLVTPAVTIDEGGLSLSPLEFSLLMVATALVPLIVQVVVLWIVELLVRSGLVAVFPWLGRQVIESFVAAGAALGRTIPLLLGVVALIYFNSEIWQSIGRLASWAYLGVLGLFLALTGIFLHSRESLDLTALATFDDADELHAILADTPLADMTDVPLPARTPLAPNHVQDLRLVATLSRLTVVVVISAAVFAFFMVLGVLSINVDTVRAWGGGTPEIVWTLVTARHRYDLTWEHLRVAGFLGVFSGFYFAVVSRTDAALRDSMGDVAEDTIREACAARLVVLARFPRR